MDPATIDSMRLLGGLGLSWVIQQFARAPQNVPTWVSWVAIAVAGSLIYWWVTPGFGQQFATDWRLPVLGVVQFMLQVRGGSSTASDFKLASPTNSK